MPTKVFEFTPNKILCAVGFDDYSREALQYACSVAREHGSTLYMLHVVEDVPGLALYSRENLDHFVHSVKDKAMDYLRKFVSGHGAGLKATPVVVFGKASEVILNFAKTNKADLIVMGTHQGGYGILQKTLFGSTAQKVIGNAECPVLAVPSRAKTPKMDSAKKSKIRLA